MEVYVQVLGADRVVVRFSQAAATLDPRLHAVVRHYGQLLATRVQAHASGRPGPNAPTGDYRRSIHAEEGTGLGGVFAVRVGTNKPQGRRLEFGFVGTDSLGRFFHQPPYAHFGPAISEIEPDFKAALVAVALEMTNA